jgi:hypothetical protein
MPVHRRPRLSDDIRELKQVKFAADIHPRAVLRCKFTSRHG